MCPECAQQHDLGYMVPKGSPMDIAMRLLKEETTEETTEERINRLFMQMNEENAKFPRPFAEFSYAELQHLLKNPSLLNITEGKFGSLDEIMSELDTRYTENSLPIAEPMTPEFQDIHTGEPMDIAMRLLKGANDPPYDSDKPYWEQPSWKNYIDPDPLGAFGIPQSHWDAIAARQEEEGNKVNTPLENVMQIFNPRTELVFDSPDTHCELHGERLEPIINQQDIQQTPKGVDGNMYCSACEHNINYYENDETPLPRQPQQFDIDEDTQEKLTGEPMDIAMRLLKEHDARDNLDVIASQPNLQLVSDITRAMSYRNATRMEDKYEEIRKLLHPRQYKKWEDARFTEKGQEDYLKWIKKNVNITHLEPHHSDWRSARSKEEATVHAQRLEQFQQENQEWQQQKYPQLYGPDVNLWKPNLFTQDENELNEHQIRWENEAIERGEARRARAEQEPADPGITDLSWLHNLYSDETGENKGEPMDIAMRLLKGTRRLEYDAGFDYPEDPKAQQVAATLHRENTVEPGPLPGFVYHDGKLMAEDESEKLWPSHIDTRNYISPTKAGLKRYAETAAFRHPREEDDYKPMHDTDFNEQRTVNRFMEEIAPGMAHEVGHALDSQMGQGSFAQQEMPAHVLEMATQEAMNARDDYPNQPIIPRAKSLVRDRSEFSQSIDDPNYQYDITDDTIVAGEPMDIAMRLLKGKSFGPEMLESWFNMGRGVVPYEEMNDRQRRVADAAFDLPHGYLGEEEWDSESLSPLFDPISHEEQSDYDYEKAEALLRHLKQGILNFNNNPETKDNFTLIEDWQHPNHPWAYAQEMAEIEMQNKQNDFGDTSQSNIFTASEPMDIAMRLLKNDEVPFRDDWSGHEEYHPGEGNEERDADYFRDMPEHSLAPPQVKRERVKIGEEAMKPPFPPTMPINLVMQSQPNYEGAPPEEDEPTNRGIKFSGDFTTGEPMDIAFQLLKTPVTPEAKQHKLEYDKKYQDNPKRVKYREELNRERRQRGVYGKGGKDMSHTKDGKIVPEDASKNRARHFKGRGTLKSFVLVKR